MTESSATSLADKLLLAILTNNPNCIGSGQLISASNAKGLAQALAAFRQTLVAELEKQKE